MHKIAKQVLEHRLGPEAAAAYRPPDGSQLAPPGVANMTQGAMLIDRALVNKRPIEIHCDYDADGNTSAALMYGFIKQSCPDATVEVYVANRSEGYGYRFVSKHPGSLKILLDCGSNDREGVETSVSLGHEVVILDHHQIGSVNCIGLHNVVLVSTQLAGTTEPMSNLCTAGIAWYMCATLRSRFAADKGGIIEYADPSGFSPYAAIGTIADVCYMDTNNRALVATGLRRLASDPGQGLSALCDAFYIRPPVSSKDISFGLIPAINAPGRLGDARPAFEAMAFGTKPAIAALRAANKKRKELQDKYVSDAIPMAEKKSWMPFVIVSSDQWQSGLVGIIAGRLAQSYRRPAAAVAIEGDIGRGSVRGVPGVDVVEVLRAAERATGEECFLKLGGHAMAAGFTVKADKLALVEAELAAAKIEYQPIHIDPDLMVLDVGQLNQDLIESIDELGPFGPGWRYPSFYTPDWKVASVSQGARGSMEMMVRRGNIEHKAVSFGWTGDLPKAGQKVDLTYEFERDTYHGGTRLVVSNGIAVRTY
jgi:single-stranded-DNA-specific exonuclease